ncbi:Mov34/MPN/PAD-1 family protein [Candidatus Palauibacter sp.]|uniref:Mov34/MPN/PAD-1 family protein n=1 Tax=Candidatus Palauibacter sp. TaxID=3101350 RepID=UPI003AF21754
MSNRHEILGEPIRSEEAAIAKARELIELLITGVLPFIRLAEVRRQLDGCEVVIVEVKPEVPTQAAHDIRMEESIAVIFDPEDRMGPTALALRQDFPDVPHTFFVPAGSMKSLCLFEEAYTEQRLHWTAAAYLRQLHLWLSKTARGELHEEDQPLEPFLIGADRMVVLPHGVLDIDRTEGSQNLSLYAIPRGGGGSFTLVSSKNGRHNAPKVGRPCTALVVEAQPQTHRGLRSQPESLSELQEFLSDMGLDLLGALRDHLTTWISEQDPEGDAHVLIVVRIPRRRADDLPVEDVGVWAFGLAESAGKTAESLGFLARFDGRYGAILGAVPVDAGADGLSIEMVNPIADLTQQGARALSGHQGAPPLQVLAIGAGALGSQTIMHLVRGGFGTWTVVDRDVVLPHNLVRHALSGDAVGWEKARAVASLANGLFEQGGVARAHSLDVLADPFPDPLLAEFNLADVIVDFTASVPAARRLALDAPVASRRISLFLNPDGTDMVLIAEDIDRILRLDQIEMQYYRAVIARGPLGEHLLRNGKRLRYANTCRDVTSAMSQDRLAILSGIAARALRETVARPEAHLSIWQLSADHTVSRLTVCLAESHETARGDWQISIDEGILRRLHELREESLPNETGGVLLGNADLLRKVLYVVDTIPSPPDSKEWPTAYIRGVAGLKEQVDDVARRTASQISYLGEWHSHPDGAACSPSPDDRKFLAWLTGHMFADGLPALMGIVCEGGEVVWQLGCGNPTNV